MSDRFQMEALLVASRNNVTRVAEILERSAELSSKLAAAEAARDEALRLLAEAEQDVRVIYEWSNRKTREAIKQLPTGKRALSREEKP